jgi:hypothetical protein
VSRGIIMPLPLLPPAAAAAWLAAGEALACYWHVEETGVCWAAQQAPPLLLRCWLLGSLLRGQRAAAAASMQQQPALPAQPDENFRSIDRVCVCVD